MPSVTIDAGALAVPPHNVSADDARRYVKTVLGWSRLIDCPWVEVNMSRDSCVALFHDNLFPFYPQLKDLIAYTDIEDFDANTINTVVIRLLDQSVPSFEEYFGVSDVLAEDLHTSPDILCQSLGDALRSDLSRCLLLAAILRKYCREFIRSHALVVRHAPSPVVSVHAVVHEVEHERNDLDELPVKPEVFEGEVLVCDDFRGLVECMNEASLLANSKDKVSLEAAVKISLFKSRLERGEEPEWDELPRFCVGDQFFGTALQACKAGGALPGKILRAIVETLEDLNLADVHVLRTGPGGNNPPRVRGNDRAMRRDIDRKYHLHYWLCEDGRVELATVSYPHDNFWIPE